MPLALARISWSSFRLNSIIWDKQLQCTLDSHLIHTAFRLDPHCVHSWFILDSLLIHTGVTWSLWIYTWFTLDLYLINRRSFEDLSAIVPVHPVFIRPWKLTQSECRAKRSNSRVIHEWFPSVARVNHEQITRDALPENFEQAKLFLRHPWVSKSKSE